MPRDLLAQAKSKAEDPGLWKRVKHSKHFDKYRRTAAVAYQGDYKAAAKKVARMGGEIGAGMAIKLIPIPYLADLVTTITNKTSGAIRSKINQGKADLAVTHREKAKFLLKELSAENLDRFRWKIADAEKTFQKLWAFALSSRHNTHSICNDYGKAMAKHYYLLNRIDKMESDLSDMKTAIKVTEDWIGSLKLNVGDREAGFKSWSKALGTLAGTDDRHHNCDPTLCVHGTGTRIASGGKMKKFLSGFSKLTAMVVDVGAPDYTSPETYAMDNEDVKARKATGKNDNFRVHKP